MKQLVVYYSRTGTTRRVAETIASELICDLEPIREPRDRSGISGYLRSSWEALIKKTPPIEEPDHDPSQFDTVIVGTPVWAHSPSSPVLTYLKRFSKMMDRTAFFCTYGGSGAETAFEKMEDAAKEPEATLKLKAGTVKNRDHLKKIKEFVDELKG